jgi:hypothetical protein
MPVFHREGDRVHGASKPELLSDVLARGVRQGLNVEPGLAEDIGRLCADLVADHAETVEPESEGSTAVEVAIGWGLGLRRSCRPSSRRPALFKQPAGPVASGPTSSAPRSPGSTATTTATGVATMGDVELKGATKCPGCGGAGELVGYRLVRACCGWVFGPVPGDCETYVWCLREGGHADD